MGLGVIVWTHIKRLDSRPDEDDNWDDVFSTCENLDYSDRVKPLEIDAHYTGERTWSFHVGTYSGYGLSRDALCRLANDMDIESFWALGEAECIKRPLGELLNFCDNQGVIGADACKRLAHQFEELTSAAKKSLVDWQLENFYKWSTAFRIAADRDGAVEFM